MRKPRHSPLVPDAGEGKRGAAGHIGYLLRQAAAGHRLKMERAMADLGITPPQFVVLTMLAAYPGLSGAELARLALLTPQTVSLIVANLVRAGALARRPHDIHGRIQHLDMTQTGRKLLARCRRRVQGVEAHLVAGLPPDEETAIRHWLVRVAAAAD